MCLQNVYTGGVQLYRFVHCGTLLGLTMSHPGRGSDRSDPLPPWSLAVRADLGWRRLKEEEVVEKEVSPSLLRCIGHVTDTGHLVGVWPHPIYR